MRCGNLQSDTQPIAPPQKKKTEPSQKKEHTEPFCAGQFFERLGRVLNPMDIAGVKDQNTYHWSSWPLVGNEGMNPQYTNVKVDSLIPY